MCQSNKDDTDLDINLDDNFDFEMTEIDELSHLWLDIGGEG